MAWIPQTISGKKYLTQMPNSASPLIPTIEDSDLEFAVKKLFYIEDVIVKMIKEMKKYLIAGQKLNEADQKLTNNLINHKLVHISSEFREIVEEYHSVNIQVDKSVEELTYLCEKTFIEPLEKLREEFTTIDEELRKREKLVEKWKDAYLRVKKYQEKKEKTGTLIAKLEKQRDIEETVARELKSFHSKLLFELNSFLDKRLDYMKPSLHALIKIQVKHYSNTVHNFMALLQSNPTNQTKVSDMQFEQLISIQINRIRGLTIVKEPK